MKKQKLRSSDETQNLRDVLKIVSHFSRAEIPGSVTLHFDEKGRLKQEKVEVSGSIRRYDGGRQRSDAEMDKIINALIPLDD